jgi:Family of unknown function (DUF5678)
MTQALSGPVVESFKAYERNLRWAKAHDDLLEPFTGKYVAVFQEKIIASGDSSEELRPKVSDHPGVYIAYVPERGLIWIL